MNSPKKFPGAPGDAPAESKISNAILPQASPSKSITRTPFFFSPAYTAKPLALISVAFAIVALEFALATFACDSQTYLFIPPTECKNYIMYLRAYI